MALIDYHCVFEKYSRVSVHFYVANMTMPNKNGVLDILNTWPGQGIHKDKTMWNCYEISINSATFRKGWWGPERGLTTSLNLKCYVSYSTWIFRPDILCPCQYGLVNIMYIYWLSQHSSIVRIGCLSSRLCINITPNNSEVSSVQCCLWYPLYSLKNIELIR